MDFGQNLIARSSSVVCVGDEIEILARSPAKIYGAGQTDETLAPEQQPEGIVSLEWEGQSFRGNNQQVLLEQQGIRVPWSCRAGIWGSSRVRLLEGEASALEKNAQAADGTILSCSCIPKTPLRLSTL